MPKIPERFASGWLTLAVGIAVGIGGGASGCNPVTTERRDTGLDGLSLDAIAPTTLLVGTTLTITGRSFVDTDLATAALIIEGTAGTARLPLTYRSSSEMRATADAAVIAALGATSSDVPSATKVTLEFVSTVDEHRYATELGTPLRAAVHLTPSASAVGDGVAFINQPIAIAGDQLLLGGDEGHAQAVLTGCFRAGTGGVCGLPKTTTIPLTPATNTARTSAAFPYLPTIAGIAPGQFTGTLRVENVHTDGVITTSPTRDVVFDVQAAQLSGTSTSAASLGQYVVLSGGGFVGGADDASTTLHLQASFVGASGKATPIDVVLVPEFRSGLELRYVLDDQDALGRAINLRKDAGLLTGTVEVIVEYGSEKVTTPAIPVQLSILPVRQIVYINFLAEWVGALRRFGLRAADQRIRDRIVKIGRRDYQAINMEFRADLPVDFAIFSQVDISGLYPAGDHSFGYDNTPGKDTNNERLYDRIGGVNAVTQSNGDPGYGGVFLESFFLFSQNPPQDIRGNVESDPVWQSMRDAMFDPIFDPFRADRGGRELTATELDALDPPAIENATGCPASDRRMQTACAIFVLANLIGSTVTHEIGHSLGLSDPYGDAFHNPGDCPRRLMDGGADRPFVERAELGEQPARFCDGDYAYLREILPSVDAPPILERPACSRCE